MPRQVLIKIRRGTESQLPVLDVGELGFCTDTNKLYIGTPNGNQLLVAAQSVGDMLKSIYDTDYDGKVDAAETADSVPWSGVTGKPTTFPPSSHDHSRMVVDDTRNINLLPTDLTSREIRAEFKYRSTVGMPGSGTYCKVITLVGWTDDSGGAVHQVGFDDNGDIYIRRGTRSSGWGGWVKLAREADVMPKGPITWNQLKGV
ncbi:MULTISPECIES: hyaluronate lyase N-terminal domain-containing protein [Geobacillus]|uniref:Phage tail protein n=1 Tax=Geobacillus thermoleovorans TaxID=33941 RepID=A0A2Z3NAQ1_GEOTH|nr:MULTISPECIES: hypothetical protein [Geobacillus]AWO73874.1 phage tail protein [Geobacillus thermoleovorans]AWO74983.1 phage tail protein [Geobacillus thermoleovorans]MBW7642543.1 phage tail protein [Geobacillus thermoleovorans]